ncbi:MAG: RluA family pseudouridine synthase [Anaerolineales bacterium]
MSNAENPPLEHTLIFEAATPQRLDRFVAESLPELSRSRVQQLIRDGLLRVNGHLPRKAGQMLTPGARVEVSIPPAVPSALLPEDIPLDILFENADVLVVNKPAGMVVHPAAGHDSGTLVHAFLAHAPEIEGVGGEKRPGIVHRLDKDTSGVIIMAKNDRTHRFLQRQFRLRETQKTYLALTDGHPPSVEGRIEAAIGRDPSHRKRMAIVPEHQGRAAVSTYLIRTRYADHALLEVHPLTGRTHQIRLHLAFLGCPIVGDTVYGHRHPSLPLARHFLHAFRLRITLPGEDAARTFEAPLPPDLQTVLEHLSF